MCLLLSCDWLKSMCLSSVSDHFYTLFMRRNSLSNQGMWYFIYFFNITSCNLNVPAALIQLCHLVVQRRMCEFLQCSRCSKHILCTHSIASFSNKIYMSKMAINRIQCSKQKTRRMKRKVNMPLFFLLYKSFAQRL